MEGMIMMKMVVRTSNNENYEKDIVSVGFFNGSLICIDKEGNVLTYTKESLSYGGDSEGMITII